MAPWHTSICVPSTITAGRARRVRLLPHDFGLDGDAYVMESNPVASGDILKGFDGVPIMGSQSAFSCGTIYFLRKNDSSQSITRVALSCYPSED